MILQHELLKYHTCDYRKSVDIYRVSTRLHKQNVHSLWLYVGTHVYYCSACVELRFIGENYVAPFI